MNAYASRFIRSLFVEYDLTSNQVLRLLKDDEILDLIRNTIAEHQKECKKSNAKIAFEILYGEPVSHIRATQIYNEVIGEITWQGLRNNSNRYAGIIRPLIQDSPIFISKVGEMQKENMDLDIDQDVSRKKHLFEEFGPIGDIKLRIDLKIEDILRVAIENAAKNEDDSDVDRHIKLLNIMMKNSV